MSINQVEFNLLFKDIYFVRVLAKESSDYVRANKGKRIYAMYCL